MGSVDCAIILSAWTSCELWKQNTHPKRLIPPGLTLSKTEALTRERDGQEMAAHCSYLAGSDACTSLHALMVTWSPFRGQMTMSFPSFIPF